jgi:hypothetical protein
LDTGPYEAGVPYDTANISNATGSMNALVDVTFAGLSPPIAIQWIPEGVSG